MKRILAALCAIILPVLVVYFSSLIADVHASATEATCTSEPSNTPQTVIIEVVDTPTPTPVTLTPPPPTPTPTAKPDLPEYDYDASWARALSRGFWSVCPRNPTPKTKRAFGELVLNRVADDSGDFENTPGKVLSQDNEFLDYDSDAYRSIENDALAVYVLRACTYADVTGDWSYRLVPSDGLYCDFYAKNGFDYIKVYNRAGDTVYDSGATK